MFIIEMLNKNKTWIFSGIGVSIIFFVLNITFSNCGSNSNPKEKQEKTQFNINSGSDSYVTKEGDIILNNENKYQKELLNIQKERLDLEKKKIKEENERLDTEALNNKREKLKEIRNKGLEHYRIVIKGLMAKEPFANGLSKEGKISSKTSVKLTNIRKRLSLNWGKIFEDYNSLSMFNNISEKKCIDLIKRFETFESYAELYFHVFADWDKSSVDNKIKMIEEFLSYFE